MTTNPRRSPGERFVIGLIVPVAVLLAACGSAASSGSAGPSSPPVASIAASNAPSSAATGSASTATQTDTEWGRIWDSLPAGFPTIPGATVSGEAASGPASATLVVNGDAAKAIATTLQAQLQGAGYKTVGLSGPLEDRAYVLDMTGSPAGCMLQVTAAPTGSLTTVTILYGAACPHG